MQLVPRLSFNGQCEEAFKFYEQVLAAKITFMAPYPEWPDKTMHATIEVGDRIMHGADAPPEHFKTPQGFSPALATKDTAEAERLFNALAEGGTVQMPLQQTFWASRFGMLTDRYGIPWMINC
jgi:PhnB protein